MATYEDPQFAAEEQEADDSVKFAQPLEKLQVPCYTYTSIDDTRRCRSIRSCVLIDRSWELLLLTSRNSRMVAYTLSKAWHTATREILCSSKGLVKPKSTSCNKQVTALWSNLVSAVLRCARFDSQCYLQPSSKYIWGLRQQSQSCNKGLRISISPLAAKTLTLYLKVIDNLQESRGYLAHGSCPDLQNDNQRLGICRWYRDWLHY